MEPLQDLVVKFIVQVEEENKNMAQTHAECAEMISEEIIVNVLDALR
jgi:hypothetical protein